MSTTSHTVTTSQDGMPSTISAVWALLAPTHMQRQHITVKNEYSQSFSQPSVKNPGKCDDQPGQNEDNAGQHSNLPSIIKSNISAKVAHENMWYGGMDTMHATIRPTVLRTSSNTLSMAIGRTWRKREHQRGTKRQVYIYVMHV